ncbi:MAG: hypothetical protein ACI92E_002268 [Oceanicoccus sp.]|jgi:hypothetical protein
MLNGSSRVQPKCTGLKSRLTQLYKRLCRTAIGFILCLCIGGLPEAKADTFNEADVKAAFLYYFLHFISWPNDGSGANSLPIELCTIDEGPVTKSLVLILASPKAASTKVNVGMMTDLDQVSRCQYIFVGDTNVGVDQAVIAKTQTEEILTVSDVRGFAESGGMIELLREGNKVKVLINIETLKKRGFKVSSKLLNLSVVVAASNQQEAR